MFKKFIKDPDAVLDFGHDWSDWLTDNGSDTIASSSWIVPDGITKDSSTNDTTTTTVWLSGGVDKARYTLVNRIVTVGGRTDDYTMIIKIKEK